MLLTGLEIGDRLGVLRDDLVDDPDQLRVAAHLARALRSPKCRFGIGSTIHLLEGLLCHLAADDTRIDQLDQLPQVGRLDRGILDLLALRVQQPAEVTQHPVGGRLGRRPERHGLLGDLARELRGEEHAARHITMRDWLEGA